jgi:DNA repair photolyase
MVKSVAANSAAGKPARSGRAAAAGVPTTVMVTPVIPAINDVEIERILDAAAACGVEAAGYVLLRLPLEVRDLFREWLAATFPDRERHAFALHVVRSRTMSKTDQLFA